MCLSSCHQNSCFSCRSKRTHENDVSSHSSSFSGSLCSWILDAHAFQIFRKNDLKLSIKHFPPNKPMRVLLWFIKLPSTVAVCDFSPSSVTECSCRLWLFFEFIQTQKRYPTSLDKISILTTKLHVISS